MNEKLHVWIDYTNYRNERRVREIRPINIWYGTTQWHPEPQWLLDAEDLGSGSTRTFALQDIHAWDVTKP